MLYLSSLKLRRVSISKEEFSLAHGTFCCLCASANGVGSTSIRSGYAANPFARYQNFRLSCISISCFAHILAKPNKSCEDVVVVFLELAIAMSDPVIKIRPIVGYARTHIGMTDEEYIERCKVQLA